MPSNRTFIKFSLIFLSFLLAFSCQPKVNPENSQTDKLTPEAGATIYGRVMCGDRPLKNVSVSDGVTVVRTGNDGVYNIKSAKENGYVFISIPSGYTMAEASLPSAGFWKGLKTKSAIPERVDFSLVREDQAQSTMIVMGDIQIFSEKSVAEFNDTFIREINKYLPSINMWPVYGLTLGDMTWDWYWYHGDMIGITNYILAMRKLNGLRIFNTVGNHDNDMQFDSLSEFQATGEDRTCMDAYRSKLGPTCFSYNISGVHFVSLDDVITTNTGDITSKNSRGNMRGVTEYDMQWLKEDLSYVSEETPVIVSIHIPLFSFRGKPQKGNADSVNASVEAITAPFKKFKNVLFISGHTHDLYNIENYDVNGLKVTEWNSGAISGNFWVPALKGLNLCTDGTPGGYRILTFQNGRYTSRYKAIGKKANYMFRAYDRNQMNLTTTKITGEIIGENKNNYVYINVWDYKPSWRITVKEQMADGTEKELTAVKVETYDPLFGLMYEKGLTDSGPQLSGTIFRAQASSPTTTLVIEVKDEYANSSKEVMQRPKEFSRHTYTTELAE